MWVIGNGESRKNIDVHALQGTKIGCNAIFRHYYTDHIVCVDRRMVNEALKNNVESIYTRPDWIKAYKDKNVKCVPELPYTGTIRADEPFNWGSGPYVLLLGAKLNSTVKLIGFDLYGKDGLVNNVYKDTQSYDSADKRAVDPRYWIHQVSKVFEIYNRRKFIIYNDDGWEMPKAWNLPNVSLDNLNNL